MFLSFHVLSLNPVQIKFYCSFCWCSEVPAKLCQKFSKDNFAPFLYGELHEPNCNYCTAQVLFCSQIAPDFVVLKCKNYDDC